MAVTTNKLKRGRRGAGRAVGLPRVGGSPARQALIVLGMHRSGTSALTRVFSLLGADLPRNVMGPGRGNEVGHWESTDLVVVHDELLASAGSRWDDWRAFNPDWAASGVAEVFRERLLAVMQADFQNSPLFLLKDPRICRFMPVWRDVLERFGATPHVTIPIRNPLEVAASLQARDGFLPAKSYLLWLRHVLDAERGTRDLPRAVTTYDALMDDWRRVARDIGGRIGVRWPRWSDTAALDIDRFMSASLRHHAVDPTQLTIRADIVAWVKAAYDALAAMAAQGENARSRATLDRVAAEFDRASFAFGLALAEENSRAEEARQEAQRLTHEIETVRADTAAEITHVRDEATRAAADAANARDEVARVTVEAARLREEAGVQTARVDELTNAHAAAREEAARLGRELAAVQNDTARLTRELDGARGLLRESQTEVQRLAGELAHAEAAIATARHERDAARADREVLAAEMQAEKTAADAVRAEAARLAAELAGVRDALAETAQARDAARHERDSLAAALDAERVASAEAHRERERLTADLAAARRDTEARAREATAAGHELTATRALIAELRGTLDQQARLVADAAPLNGSGAGWTQTMRRLFSPQARARAARGTEHAAIARSRLFDALWYLERYPDVAAAGDDPLWHYLMHGAAEGREPHPLFDGKWYAGQAADLAGSGLSPLGHYVMQGAAARLDPHPLFDTDWYLAQNPDVAAARINPLYHFWKIGAAAGRDPHPLFDTSWYLERNPDVARAGDNALYHYLVHGWREGRDPHPEFKARLNLCALLEEHTGVPGTLNVADIHSYPPFNNPARHELGPDYKDFVSSITTSGLFDREWYLTRYPNVAKSDIDPLDHFCQVGIIEGHNPHEFFDTNWYLHENPDVAAAGVNPIIHYVENGVLEGRPCHPSFEPISILKRLRVFDGKLGGGTAAHIDVPDPSEFDEEAYINCYADIRSAVESGHLKNGLEHWLSYGHEEERAGVRNGEWRKEKSLVQLKKALMRTLNSSTVERLPPYIMRWRTVLSRVERLPSLPKISILMPVYNVDARWLSLAIESVHWQLYQNWELCIVDDCSPNEEVRSVLRRWAARDKRIKVAFRTENGHISAATNDALAMAEGDYVGLLDHDDELTVDALAEVAFYLAENPDADYIYSDEDKIDERGELYGRFYKPDWSPEFILSCGYTTHFSVYRKSVIARVGGFRSTYDGAQDYDLTLRVVSATSKVGHIPKLLYHWRTIASSTALSANAKPYAYISAKAALRDHMHRIGLHGDAADGSIPGYTRAIFEVAGRPTVSIVIPTAGKSVNIGDRRINLIENCVESIRNRSSWPNIEIIVSENGNLSNQTLSSLAGWGARLVSYREPKFNLAQKLNLSCRHATGEYLILLNDDIEVITADWIEQMLQYQQLPNVGAVGAKLLFPDRTIQHIGVTVIDGRPGHAYYRAPEDSIGHGGICSAVHNVVAVTGACMMTPRALYFNLGGYDEAFDLNYNDVDYCLRLIEAGYRNVVTPFAELWHYESVSRDNSGGVRADELALFRSRWAELYKRERFMRV